MNAPWPYMHPYGMPMYPPTAHYPQVQPHPNAHGAGVGAAHLPPWGYGHHPVAPPPVPTLHPVATQHGKEAPPGDEDRVSRTGSERGDATPSIAGAQGVRKHPNKRVFEGGELYILRIAANKNSPRVAWQFMVEVTDDQVMHVFTAHTNMSWQDFDEKAHGHFNKARDGVCLGYRLNGDTRAMSELSCEYHWTTALSRVRDRCIAARTRAVTMELRNMVSGDTRTDRKLY